MKKMLSVVIPLKSFASLIFTGLICLYMVMGSVSAAILQEPFDYSVPFIFVLQGLVLAIAVSLLWAVFLGDAVIRNMRYFLRLILFSVSLLALLAMSLLVFLAIPTAWAKLWLLVICCVVAAVILLSVLCEWYLKATGKRYTEILNAYKTNIL